jgi:hypothetical protein
MARENTTALERVKVEDIYLKAFNRKIRALG